VGIKPNKFIQDAHRSPEGGKKEERTSFGADVNLRKAGPRIFPRRRLLGWAVQVLYFGALALLIERDVAAPAALVPGAWDSTETRDSGDT
jgi:hypothetical protein